MKIRKGDKTITERIATARSKSRLTSFLWDLQKDMFLICFSSLYSCAKYLICVICGSILTGHKVTTCFRSSFKNNPVLIPWIHAGLAQDRKNASSSEPSIYFLTMTYFDDFYSHYSRVNRINYSIVTCTKAICIFCTMEFATPGRMGVVR